MLKTSKTKSNTDSIRTNDNNILVKNKQNKECLMTVLCILYRLKTSKTKSVSYRYKNHNIPA